MSRTVARTVVPVTTRGFTLGLQASATEVARTPFATLRESAS